jgi:hypothetical protein
MKTVCICFVFAMLSSACAVYTVADTAVSVGATVVKTTVKATAAVIDAVIPDSKSDKK